MNKNMKNKLSRENIDPYSSEGRSEIYCRFVLENPRDLVSYKVNFWQFNLILSIPGIHSGRRVRGFDHSSNSCAPHAGDSVGIYTLCN